METYRVATELVTMIEACTPTYDESSVDRFRFQGTLRNYDPTFTRSDEAKLNAVVVSMKALANNRNKEIDDCFYAMGKLMVITRYGEDEYQNCLRRAQTRKAHRERIRNLSRVSAHE